VFPDRLGGDPIDDRVLEEEDPGGRSAVGLLGRLVSARSTPTSCAMRSWPGSGEDGVERVMALLSRGADVVRVERGHPTATSTGKIRLVRVWRRPAGTLPTREPV
jgi:hypothetical protein